MVKEKPIYKGIQANKVIADVLAVGDSAKAIKNVEVASDENMTKAISDLNDTIGKLDLNENAEKVVKEDINQLKNVIQKEKVDKNKVKGLLNSIIGKLKMVGIAVSKTNTLVEPINKISSSLGDRESFIKNENAESMLHKDVFLCHASDDKKTIVEPLFHELISVGISCWYDNAEIKWGDSITSKVNEGLSKSEYVIVVLSESFMKKHWTKRELMAALNKESSTGRVIVLPLVFGSPKFLKKLHEEFFLQNDKAFIEWRNNPSEIAAIMHDRLTERH